MLQVIKADGNVEPFSVEKVRLSIIRAGVPEELQKKVLEHVQQKAYNNIKTSEIFHHIVEFLGKSNHPYTRSRYSLKQAIMDLGPTGYPFEDYIAEIFKYQGYQTQTRIIVKGACVTHEIDVIAEKDSKRLMVEAKFHHGSGTRTDVHVSLYTKARFDDTKVRNNFDEGWLVTNTKATTEAIVYAECVGMKVMGWSYPENESLRDLVERAYLIPVTALTSVSQSQKQVLLDQHVILCKDICGNPSSLNTLNLPEDKKHTVLSEAEFICKS